MGALTRFRSYLLTWMYQHWQTYPAFANSFASDLMAVVPGLTIGPTVPLAPGPPPTYQPAGLGEQDGEIYLSNDLGQLNAWIWWSNAWWPLSGTGAGASLYSFGKYSKDADDGGLYREIVGQPFPSSVIWYTSGAKTQKVKELIITRDGNQNVTQEQWKFYDNTGLLTRTYTDAVVGGAIETSRTRTIV